MKRIAFFALIAGLGLCFFTAPAQAETSTERVKTVLDKAMEIQTRQDLSGEAHKSERAKLIRQLMADSFLMQEMAQETVKERWNKISQKQRNDFEGLFVRLFTDSYTRMVLNFLKRENVEYKGESTDGKGTIVKTVLMRTNEHIPVDYHLSQKNGRWYMTDVDIDEVSIVDNYRETFRNVILNGSFDSLLQKMRVQSKTLQD